MSRTVSAEPREPSTVEKRVNTGVSTSLPRNAALVTLAAVPYPLKTPCAAAPRACTTRSGMRSWSKWVIFSRRWWSWSRTGPRGPALREWSVSYSRAPCAVVRYAPACPVRRGSVPVSWPVGLTVSGVPWSGLGGSGSLGAVGSATVGVSGPGRPGTPSGGPSPRSASAAFSANALTGFLSVIALPR